MAFAASATSDGRTATLMSGFDFQHGVSYQCSTVIITLTGTVYESEGMGQTDGWTEG